MTESEQQRFEVILEDINGKLNLVLEGHAALDEKIERYHQEARKDHRLAMDLIKFSHDELKEEIQGVRTELKQDIQDVRTELKEEIQGVQTELKQDIQGVQTELKEEIQAVDRHSGERDAALEARLTAEIRAVGDKVDGHEARIAELERKAA